MLFSILAFIQAKKAKLAAILLILCGCQEIITTKVPPPPMFKLGVYEMAGSYGLFSDIQQFRLEPSPSGGEYRITLSLINGRPFTLDARPRWLSGTDLYGGDSLYIRLAYYTGRQPDDSTHRFNSIYVIRRPAPQKETFDVCFNCWAYNQNGHNRFNLQEGVSEKYTYNWIGK